MIKVFIPVILSSIVFAACCTCSNTANNSADIPEKLQRKADDFVISKTGEDFFNQYIKPDYAKITKIKDGYHMVYSFSVPDKEGIEGEIRFSLDSLGNVQKNKEVAGIPECSPGSGCDFKISKDEAADIAKQSGLEEGVKDWEVKFAWDNEYRIYTWQIRTMLSETKGTGRSSGKVMFIDPVNGNVLDTKEWRGN
ncbi:MAG: hypothetical protein EHM47_14230 [Ignavibacteriales bacterium]|nr:MAG: hypothetical protein EHM47_14230 [Ignavibacteriales bacterium]